MATAYFLYPQQHICSAAHRSLSEVFVLEYQQVEYPYTDITVGKVEYWAEECEFVSSHPREPRRICAVDYRKIEHVYDFTVQESRITLSWRYEVGRFGARQIDRGAFGENKAVERTVYNVSECADEYQDEPYDHSCRGLFFVELYYVPTYYRYRNDTEEAQY